MPGPSTDGAPDPARARVLAALVGAAVAIGLLAALDPSTLRPGAWTVTFHGALAAGGLACAALLTVGRRWRDPALGTLVVGLMGIVVLSVLANQDRAGGMLNVVLLLPLAVYAAVHLSRRACRAVTAAMVVCVAVVTRSVTDVPEQGLTLVALPVLAFLGTTEVVLRLRDELGRTAEALRERSLTDPLTGLLNRRALEERLSAAPGQTPGSAVCTVLVLDIDHFKVVNDSLGHDAGDEVLRRFGAGLARETRGEDVVVRMGGEEFLVLSSTPAEHAEAFAETLRTRAAQWMDEWTVTVSVGVLTVSHPPPGGLVGDALRSALKAADACLYAAKAGGRDRVVVTTWPDLLLSRVEQGQSGSVAGFGEGRRVPGGRPLERGLRPGGS